MGEFKSELVIRELTLEEIKQAGLKFDTDYFKLSQPLEYCSPIVKDIIIPVGFITDLASIPRIFWSILPPDNPRWSRAAVVHDWLYKNQPYSRAIADKTLLDGMTALHAPKWKRLVMYWAVRLFGRIPWNRYKAARG